MALDRGLRAPRRPADAPRSSAATGASTGSAFPRFDSGACFAALARHGGERPLDASARRASSAAPGGATAGHARPRDRARDRRGRRAAHRLHAAARRRSPTSCASSRASAGGCEMRMELVMRFDYGSIVPWVRNVDGTLIAIAGPGARPLRTPVELEGAQPAHVRRRSRCARATSAVRPDLVAVARALRRSRRRRGGARRTPWRCWQEWSERCTDEGPLARGRRRSLHHAEGAHLRADRRDRRRADDVAPRGARRRPELGLPLLLAARRDAHAARVHPRRLHRRRRAHGATGCCARSPARPTTSRSCTASPASGGSPSSSCPGSPGYEGSRPVRIGNGAVEQLQLDVYGEVIDALYLARRQGLAASDDAWALARKTFDWLESNWQEPDEGIWEVRGPRRHFTHSKVMAWVAFDRAVKTVEQLDREGPIDRWRAPDGRSGRTILARASTPSVGAFVQYFGSDRLDASLLLIPLVGFLPRTTRVSSARSRRSSATSCATASSSATARTRRTSTSTGCRRARACSCRARSGSPRCSRSRGALDEAVELYERLLSLRNDLGLHLRGVRPGARAARRQLPAGVHAPRRSSRPPSRSRKSQGRKLRAVPRLAAAYSAAAEGVRPRERRPDGVVLGDLAGERAERLELRDEDVAVLADALEAAAREDERLGAHDVARCRS